jgi:hypothetical protein
MLREELLMDLAVARTEAMITSCEAAALRTQLELLTERRPRWRMGRGCGCSLAPVDFRGFQLGLSPATISNAAAWSPSMQGIA